MNNQNKHYQQLTQEPRYQIFALRKAGMSMRAIDLAKHTKETGIIGILQKHTDKQ